MYNIALSLKFKQLYHDIADKIFSQLPTKNNNFTIFTHLRFGDYHKKNDFITRCNQEMIDNLSNYFECHKTNMIQPTIYFLIDNKNNPNFLHSMKKFNYTFIDEKAHNVYNQYVKSNEMTFLDVHHVSNSSVVDAIIEMILATKGNEFIGYNSSTFSNYIQFLRYTKGKSFYNYSNLIRDNKRIAYYSNLKTF